MGSITEDGLDAVCDAQGAEGPVDVSLDRSFRYAKTPGDFLVCKTLSYHGHDLLLSARQGGALGTGFVSRQVM